MAAVRIKAVHKRLPVDSVSCSIPDIVSVVHLHSTVRYSAHATPPSMILDHCHNRCSTGRELDVGWFTRCVWKVRIGGKNS